MKSIACVCTCVWAYVCVYMWMHVFVIVLVMCVYMGVEVRGWCQVSFSIFYILFFEIVILSGSETHHLARLTGQWAPETLLCLIELGLCAWLLFWHWGSDTDLHTCTASTLSIESSPQLQILDIYKQSQFSNIYEVSKIPLAVDFKICAIMT